MIALEIVVTYALVSTLGLITLRRATKCWEFGNAENLVKCRFIHFSLSLTIKNIPLIFWSNESISRWFPSHPPQSYVSPHMCFVQGTIKIPYKCPQNRIMGPLCRCISCCWHLMAIRHLHRRVEASFLWSRRRRRRGGVSTTLRTMPVAAIKDKTNSPVKQDWKEGNFHMWIFIFCRENICLLSWWNSLCILWHDTCLA